MPWPPNDMFVMLAKMNFIAKGIKLPVDWEELTDKITDPSNAAGRDMYPEAFKPAERMTAPNSPMNLFRESTLNKYHTETAKEIGEQYEKFIEGICGAISTAIGQWMSAGDDRRRQHRRAGRHPSPGVRGRAAAHAVDPFFRPQGDPDGAEIFDWPSPTRSGRCGCRGISG